jgi:hypothetical protein
VIAKKEYYNSMNNQRQSSSNQEDSLTVADVEGRSAALAWVVWQGRPVVAHGTKGLIWKWKKLVWVMWKSDLYAKIWVPFLIEIRDFVSQFCIKICLFKKFNKQNWITHFFELGFRNYILGATEVYPYFHFSLTKIKHNCGEQSPANLQNFFVFLNNLRATYAGHSSSS